MTAELRRLRAARQRRIIDGGSPTGFLFTNPQGNPLSPGYVTHAFRRLVARADTPPVRLHDLRHGAASLSLAAGNELKTVQAMLGHASIVLTADTYTSVLPCLAHQAAEATAALVMQAAHHTARTVRTTLPPGPPTLRNPHRPHKQVQKVSSAHIGIAHTLSRRRSASRRDRGDRPRPRRVMNRPS